MSDKHTSDSLDAVAYYAPTSTSVSSEWTLARKKDTLAGIIGDGDPAAGVGAGNPVHDIPLRFIPADAGSLRRRRLARLPLAASVAVLAVAASTVLAVVVSGGSSSDRQAGGLGPVFDPPAALSGTALGSGQYAYRVDRQIDIGADGTPKPQGPNAMVNRNWVAPNGDIVSFRTGSQNGCLTFAHSGAPDFAEPTRSFFASLPTDADALNTYLRHHVQGSSSRDEAVFVAVGDALRTADGLATPRLRGAMVGVLSRTPGVAVHQHTRDYLGRPALRTDFVDQRIRPGEVQSLYFDPATFQLLEQRDGSNNQPKTYSGPSPAYDAPAPAHDGPQELGGAAFVDVMTGEKIVAKLPTIPHNCRHN